jgi:hypothetical protein
MSGKRGQPTKYTDALAEAICKDIERGNTFRTAAIINGIGERTFYDWKEHYPQFSQRTLEAAAKAEANVVSSLGYLIEKSDFNAIKFYLTHRNNDGWRPPKETKVLEGNADAPLTVKVLKGVSMDDL